MARNRNQTVEEPEVIEVDETDEDEETDEVSKPITPADIALSTGADPKAIRGWLRSNFPRTHEMKGKSWDIPADAANAALEHFAPKDPEDDDTVGLEDLED